MNTQQEQRLTEIAQCSPLYNDPQEGIALRCTAPPRAFTSNLSGGEPHCAGKVVGSLPTA